MAVIKDVARRAGVSSATVSRVLSNKPHVSEAVRARVLKAVEELGYRPNRIARSLRVQRSRVIGLMVSDIQNPFFNKVVRAVEDTAYQHGYGVFLCNSDENPEKERFYLELFRDEQVTGVILAPTRSSLEPYAELIGSGAPLVLIDREIEEARVDTVVTNNEAAACDLVMRLVEAGYQRIGAVLSDLGISTGAQRFAGYRRALKRAGISFDEALVRFGRPIDEDGYQLADDLLRGRSRPDALFIGSKLLTSGTLRYVLEHGIDIGGKKGEGVGLASFDALEWPFFQPPMWVAEQPAYDLGARAANLLLARLDDPDRTPERVVLPSHVRRLTPHPAPLPAALVEG